MRLKMTARRFRGGPPVGTLEWDSDTGSIVGTAAHEFLAKADEARRDGTVMAGPQFAYNYPIRDPLRKPDEFAAIIGALCWDMPEALAPFYPEFPNPFEADPSLRHLSRAERARVVF